MSWMRPRKLLRFKGHRASSRRLGPAGNAVTNLDVLAPVRAASICIASGKGGTGKSLVTASLSCLFARTGKTLIVDGDLGVGNAHILQDVSPHTNFANLVYGDAPIEDLVTPCRTNLDLIGAGSGIARLASLSGSQMHVLASGLEKLELGYQYLLVDSAAGISNQTVALAAACDVVVLVTTPDVTAMTDAYAFFKVLLQRRPNAVPLLVINRVTSDAEARGAARRISEVSRKFLGREPRWIGNLSEDESAHRSVQRRQPLVHCLPEARLSAELGTLQAGLVRELARGATHGLGRTLLRHVGTSPARA